MAASLEETLISAWRQALSKMPGREAGGANFSNSPKSRCTGVQIRVKGCAQRGGIRRLRRTIIRQELRALAGRDGCPELQSLNR